jgi:hypothetical protein
LRCEYDIIMCPVSYSWKIWFVLEITEELIEDMIQGYFVPRNVCFLEASEVGLCFACFFSWMSKHLRKSYI